MAQGGMVDVSDKDVTVRTAKAEGRVILTKEAFRLAKSGTSAKGDVFSAARIAAIHAAKSTSNLIPMCHTVMIEAVDVDFALDEDEESVLVTAAVKSTGKTGVEMEALTAVSIACLTIYDMLKYAGKGMVISDVKLMEKSGGRSGDYKRQD
jgi:molybdenum cofactor biosynthesis protein MoaC